VYLEGQNKNLIFEYNPKSYSTGKSITIISSIIILLYFGYFIYSRKFKGGKSQS